MSKEIIDIMIFESGSGGDLNLKNDDLETVSGLTNQVYLALFGGNIEQSTNENLNLLEKRNDWFGNNLLPTEQQFNSIFEKTIREITLTSAGIQILENAAKKDLEYLSEYADIEISGSIVSRDRFELIINLIEPDDNSTKIKFVWDGTKNELIEYIII